MCTISTENSMFGLWSSFNQHMMNAEFLRRVGALPSAVTVGALPSVSNEDMSGSADQNMIFCTMWIGRIWGMSCNLSDMLPISGVALDLQTAQVQYTCPHCPFVTHSIPNWRRHCTVQHQLPRHRTAAIAILGMSLHGRPQCNHCHKIFTTWRRFTIHVERNCCQVCK